MIHNEFLSYAEILESYNNINRIFYNSNFEKEKKMNQILPFTKRVSQLACAAPDHEEDIIISVCISPECT